jgi:hypothetical protein
MIDTIRKNLPIVFVKESNFLIIIFRCTNTMFTSLISISKVNKFVKTIINHISPVKEWHQLELAILTGMTS